MGNIILFSVNIAMEATIILVMALLLITLSWQKNYLSTARPLIYLSCCMILTLITQIVVWALLIMDAPSKYGALPLGVMYVFDYIFSYGVSIAFFYYVEVLAIDGYKRIGVDYRPKKILNRIVIYWGIISAVVYAASLFIPTIYRVEEGVVIFSVPAYVALNIGSKFACICAMVYIIIHREVIGRHEAALSFCFLTLISIFFIVDELFDVCVGRVLMALFVFIIYVRVDLHRGLLVERQEREIVEWKTQIMLSQIQPHFLYNVLTTISGMCEMQNAFQARDVVNRFADYFRTNLDALGKEKTIPFSKELEHIETYLWLEKIRFEERINIKYNIGPKDFSIPALTIQPIVENAVKHGILPKDDSGTINISTYETATDYVISIEDDGVGFDVNGKRDDSRTHVGIENITKRLEIISNGSCEIESEIGKGTIAKIYIPKGDLS